MKKITLIALMLLCALTGIRAQEWVKVEASDLTLVGKAFDTPNPYHRIDTVAYKGFTKRENEMCRFSAGLAVLFRTDASSIGVSLDMGAHHQTYR